MVRVCCQMMLFMTVHVKFVVLLYTLSCETLGCQWQQTWWFKTVYMAVALSQFGAVLD